MVLAATRNIIINSLTTKLLLNPKNIKPPSRNKKGEIKNFQKLALNFARAASQIKNALKNKVNPAAQPKNAGLTKLNSSPVMIIKLYK